ncbi:MAG: sigma-70 family RNA polymerase sigma factor [Proteobacteria bacterium]|nr:sigma-70 family RNA polymerase sigma factor [Pseudomonadota bacterium]
MENVLSVTTLSGNTEADPVESSGVDERRLVERARKGDVPAFEALYRRNSGRIYALCLRLASDAGIAEECTQETFVTAWRKLEGFRGDSAFSSWLYRIAVNTVMGWFRKQVRRDRHIRPVADDEWERIEEHASDTGVGMDLEAAIATLPEGARTVFVLHDVDGRRHEEIADMTGIAVGTSKAQLHRARRLLRERLEK